MTVLMVMAALFLFKQSTMLILVAGFVFIAGQGELMAVRRREAMHWLNRLMCCRLTKMTRNHMSILAWEASMV